MCLKPDVISFVYMLQNAERYLLFFSLFYIITSLSLTHPYHYYWNVSHRETFRVKYRWLFYSYFFGAFYKICSCTIFPSSFNFLHSSVPLYFRLSLLTGYPLYPSVLNSMTEISTPWHLHNFQHFVPAKRYVAVSFFMTNLVSLYHVSS